MAEFVVAVMGGVAFVLYQIWTSIFVTSEHRIFYQLVLLGFILFCVIVQKIRKSIRKSKVKKLNLDVENYFYYDRNTSYWNRLRYIVSYLFQDWLFEIKRTNNSFNLSKSMLRYDDSLGEYFVEYRLMWYAYIKKNMLKNKLSIKKLEVFSIKKKIAMILEICTEEQQETFKKALKDWEEKTLEFSPAKKYPKSALKSIEGIQTLPKLLIQNMYDSEEAKRYIRKNEPIYQEMLKREKKRQEDIRAIKNFGFIKTKEEKNRRM